MPREHDLTRVLALAAAVTDLRTQVSAHYSELAERTRRKTLLFSQQAEQKMLRADVVVRQLACVVLRKHDHLSRTRSEAVEHRARLTPP